MLKLVQKSLIILSVVILLIIPGAFAYEIVPAEEQRVVDPTLAILSDVVGLNINAYITNQTSEKDSKCMSLIQKETNFFLTSNESQLRVSCSFVKNQLHEVYLGDRIGRPIFKQLSASTVEMAKSFLERYESYTKESFYSQLRISLDNIAVNSNATKSINNMQLEVTTTDRSSEFIWTYIDESGIRADKKNVILSYECGELKAFLNNWPLYSVAGNPKITAEEATTIAIEASKNFSYQITTDNGSVETVTGFKIAPKSLGHEAIAYLNFNDPVDARGGDPFILYPSWYVPLGFDKFYPGGVSSMAVLIWADTGQVNAMQEIVIDSAIQPVPSTKEESITSQEMITGDFSAGTAGQIVLIGVLSVGGLSFCVAGKMFSPKRIHKPFWAILFCVLMLFSVLAITVSEVSADTPTTKSRLYSCEHTDTGYENGTVDDAEGLAAAEVCNYIGNLSQNYGYSTSNNHGWETIAEDVIDHAATDESSFDRTMVFHAGHLVDAGRSYQDDNGSRIYDDFLYDATELGNHFFVFLWVCSQANNPIVNGNVTCYDTAIPSEDPGTPIGWTHRDGSAGHPFMSADGFTDPDGNEQCYISFNGMSPMLSGIPQSTFFEYGGVSNAKEFIKKFYDYAFNDGLSVHDALDWASRDYYGEYFSTCILSTGYNSYWPGGNFTDWKRDAGYYPKDFFPEELGAQMKVFGDATIHLVNPVTETFSVDYFSAGYNQWDRVGSSPYLQSGTSSYIYESGADTGDASAYFYFTTPNNGQGRIESVKLKLFCGQTDPERRMQFNVSVAQAKNNTITASSYVFYQNHIITPQYRPNVGDGAWEEIDITSWVYNWETIDNARLKFIYRNYYGSYQVRIYAAEIEVTYYPIVGYDRDVIIIGSEASYPWLGSWINMLKHFGYTYAMVDPSQVSRGIINKAHALIVAPNVVDELPGRNNLWGASLIQEASATKPVLAHMYSYCYQIYRQDDTNYGDGWGPLQSAYKHSNATSIRDLEGADMQNITFNMGYSYFSYEDVPFYNNGDGYLRTVDTSAACWDDYAVHTIVAWEHGSQDYAAIVHGSFYSGEGILVADLEGIYSSDWNCRNLIFYVWLDKVDFFINGNKCPISDYIKDWCANGYEYLSYDDVLDEITSILNNDDGEITALTLGQSVQGRDIKALQIGSGGGANSDVVLMVAGIHGDEKAAVAGALNLAVVFDNLYKTNSSWEHVLDSHMRIVIVPCNNPDGYVSYTRNNSNNIDLNRNYEYGIGDTQSETRAIMNFVGNNSIVGYVGFHMGSAGKFLTEGETTGLYRHDYPYRDYAYALGYRVNDTLVYDAKIYHNTHNRILGIGDSETLMGQAFGGTQWLHIMLNEDCPAVTYETQPGFDGDEGESWKSTAREMSTAIVQMAVVGIELAHVRFQTLIPDGEGSTLEFSNVYGANYHYAAVDDNTDSGDGDNSYVAPYSMEMQHDLYTATDLNDFDSGMRIHKIAVFAIGRGTSGPSIVVPSLRTQSTFYQGTDQNLGTSYTTVACTWLTNPNTGNAWTGSDIDNLQIGQKANHVAIRVTEVYALIQYDILHSP